MNEDTGTAAALSERSQAEVEAIVTTFLGMNDPFRRRSPEKWSPGENVEHLRLSVRPLNLALLIPRFALRVFGKPRVQRSYEEVVEQYRGSLGRGARASAPFIPAPLAQGMEPDRLIRAFRDACATYSARLLAVDEALLDSIRLPHPILGRLSLREMAFFTLYHLRHHHDAIRRDGGAA